MIKKCIASIFIILIIINSIGCMSYYKITTDDKNRIEKADKIRLTTVDKKVYQLRNVKIEGSKIFGNQWVENKNLKFMKIRREFSAEQILYIEIEQVDIIWVVLGSAVILSLFALSNTPVVN
jgi:hypothetical protein